MLHGVTQIDPMRHVNRTASSSQHVAPTASSSQPRDHSPACNSLSTSRVRSPWAAETKHGTPRLGAVVSTPKRGVLRSRRDLRRLLNLRLRHNLRRLLAQEAETAQISSPLSSDLQPSELISPALRAQISSPPSSDLSPPRAREVKRGPRGRCRGRWLHRAASPGHVAIRGNQRQLTRLT